MAGLLNKLDEDRSQVRDHLVSVEATLARDSRNIQRLTLHKPLCDFAEGRYVLLVFRELEVAAAYQVKRGHERDATLSVLEFAA